MEKGFLNGRGVKETENNGQSGSKSASKNVTHVADVNTVYTLSATTNIAVNIDMSSLNEKIRDMEVKCSKLTGSVIEKPNASWKNSALNAGNLWQPSSWIGSTTPNAETSSTISGLHSTKNMRQVLYINMVTSEPMTQMNKFASTQGLEDVLENLPYMIRNVPNVLKKWSSDVSLAKEDLTKGPALLMLDSYTSSMCIESWGRGSFARALTELDDTCGLKDMLVVAIPKSEGLGYTIETIRIEYEWKPPRCDKCKIFGNSCDSFPKVPSSSNTPPKARKQKDV
ncbi:hypothetical protein Tco_0381240 [Tanacetum coccineum]